MTDHRLSFHRRWPGLGALFTAVALFASACGGVGTGGTGAFTMGSITGFGSVIVNGVRFDDTTARVEDDEGVGMSRDDLRLGMVIEIDSAPIAGAEASATRIRIGSELRGPIETVDRVARRIQVMGQTVQIDDDTLFGPGIPGGMIGLLSGRLIEVHGQIDAGTGLLRATRIDLRLAVLSFKLRAPLSSIDTVAQTLRIGTQVFSFADALVLPADLGSLRWVRLIVRTQRNGAGQWQIVAMARAVPMPATDLDQVSIKGLITQFSSASSFVVNGVTVDASAAAFPDGTAGLGIGTRVIVEGAAVAGVLTARRVEIETDDQRKARGFALTGDVLAVNPIDSTLTLRGVPIYWGRGDVVWVGGNAVDLVNGRRVLLLGVTSADGTRLEAVRIQFL